MSLSFKAYQSLHIGIMFRDTWRIFRSYVFFKLIFCRTTEYYGIRAELLSVVYGYGKNDENVSDATKNKFKKHVDEKIGAARECHDNKYFEIHFSGIFEWYSWCMIKRASYRVISGIILKTIFEFWSVWNVSCCYFFQVEKEILSFVDNRKYLRFTWTSASSVDVFNQKYWSFSPRKIRLCYFHVTNGFLTTFWYNKQYEG